MSKRTWGNCYFGVDNFVCIDALGGGVWGFVCGGCLGHGGAGNSGNVDHCAFDFLWECQKGFGGEGEEIDG
ncbi:Hypothetical predicted protein [Olea europaea subsp. europaea]|uniref:Uncharacterized protein n=1 Tax=Olea europaea subsp. europaea TaxID=158383 RepID=A0A8S0SGP3_OLEEU|nr:Hypothetical predicted protein [Olea europaea subsp. europaea]